MCTWEFNVKVLLLEKFGKFLNKRIWELKNVAKKLNVLSTFLLVLCVYRESL